MITEKYKTRKNTVYELMSNELYVPMSEKELGHFLQVKKEDKQMLKTILTELLQEGKIQITPKGKYQRGSGQVLIGTFIGHTKGFGFVEIEGQDEDFFIPETKVNGAFHKDIVQIELLQEQIGKRQEAEVTRIVERAVTQLVGTYQKSKNFGFVVPDNNRIPSDIFVTNERSKGAVEGHKVVVEITKYGSQEKNPEGKIVEILGHINDPGVDIMSIIKGYELPLSFNEKVMNQAERVEDVVSQADCKGRLDLSDTLMITIDGEDAKDLDDAVSLTKEGDCYKLGVHIADVTNYVQENSALDREAYNRGTSVYLVDRVIPMLPHKLSNGICSLNAGEKRLALSCIMTVNGKGEVVDHQMAETVIEVDKRMSYTIVADLLDHPDSEYRKEYADLIPMLEDMRELALLLRKKRKKRGSIDFDFPETKMILDPEGRPIEIKPYDRNIATKIIEDFMLLANETVAQNFYWLELPFVYRTHDVPDGEKIIKLKTLIQNFGYSIKTTKEEIHPKELQKLLERIEGTPEEDLISRLTLRSMKQAKYTVESSGHFGLACDYYCHFTSPIRRYPDLQIHRIIKEYLRGKLQIGRIDHYGQILAEVASHSSKMERRAEEAERETIKLKKVEYMEARIGEEFQGVISGITNWGIYVELDNTIEGMIHVSKLAGDYFYYDDSTYEMIGEKTGQRYKLGQLINIIVNGCDKIGRTIDFVLPYE